MHFGLTERGADLCELSNEWLTGKVCLKMNLTEPPCA
jgi:hypothetical protein